MTIKLNNFVLAEEEYANTSSGIRELAKKYNINRQVFSGWLLAKGYNIENKRAQKSCNINYFDNIDNEEKAYWLGFLFADGAITNYKTSYNIELGLKLEDKEHIKKFANVINKKHLIINNYRCRCIIGSKHMFNILINYGCTTRKSLTLKFPNINIFKNKSYIYDFIRGYIDGDGCLSYSNKNHTQPLISVLGTEDFLNGIKKSLNIKNKLHKRDNIYILQISGKTAYDIAKKLYSTAKIYLERKYKKYKEFCRLYQE